MLRVPRPSRLLRRLRIVAVVFNLLGAFGVACTRADEAGEVVDRIGTGPGICVLVGVDDAALPLELAAKRNWLVFAQAASEKRADELRAAAAEAGLLGTRMYVEQGTPSRLP